MKSKNRQVLTQILTVVLLSLPLAGIAQVTIPDTIPGKGFFIGQLNLAKHIMDFFSDKRDASNAAKLDSNYIGYYPEKLMFSGSLTQTGGLLMIKDDYGTYQLGSNISRSLGLRASYRGMAMCFSLNPFNMFGNTDTEFDISMYGDNLVLDFVYQNSHSLSGTYTSDYSFGNQESQQLIEDIDGGYINRRTMTLGAMYVFNSRRFSYAAAFDQTCFQKRSCGSFLLGANYLYNRIQLNLGEWGNIYMKGKMLGIGCGYGYNLVLPKRWLVSTSALFELGLWSRNYLDLPEFLFDAEIEAMQQTGAEASADYELKKRYSYEGLPMILIPRIAVIHHFGRYFAGFTSLGTFHYEKYEGENNYHFVFSSNLLFGLRL